MTIKFPSYKIYKEIETDQRPESCRILESFLCADGIRTRIVDGIYTIEEAKLKIENLNGKK